MSLEKIRRVGVLAVFLTLLAGTIPAGAVYSSYYLTGLGLHEETGRKIYLGALYLPNEAERPTDLRTLTGKWIMEYRIVARRTSIRSLLGGMLLQSEIATGQSPSASTTELADTILTSVQSSLRAGDSFAISTDGRTNTTAILNGTAMAQVNDPAVAAYLLAGWISENGPTTAFRSGLIAADIDPGLRSILDANAYSEERAEEVASWMFDEEDLVEEEPVEEQVAAAPEPEPEPEPEPAVEPEEDNSAAVAAAAAASAAAVAAAEPTPAPEPVAPKAEPAPAPEPEPEPVQVAAAEPVEASPEDDIMSMDVQEYSRRLAEFHGGMVAMVYRQIKYPKRAVRRNLQGRLELDLSLTTSGSLESVVVSQSSGHKLLDNAAIDAAERAFESSSVSVDSVAMAEFAADDDTLIIPIPVAFKLAQ